MSRHPREPLDPQVKGLFDLMAARRAERVLEPRTLRAGLEPLVPLLDADAPEVGGTRDLDVPAPGGAVRARLVQPSAEPDAARPLVVFFHGGGYLFMGLDTHDAFVRRLCLAADAAVLSVAYRLAPEHPFPAPQEDCLAAYRFARSHGAELGAPGGRVAVAGDSAGGNAAAAVCLRAAAAGEAPPDAALLVCPWLDMALDTPSLHRFGPDDALIDTELMHFFRDSFVRPQQVGDPFASPLRGDLSAFPPSYLVLAGLDPLVDEGRAFARRLAEAGRPAEVSEHPGMPHDFVLFPTLGASRPAIASMGAFLAHHLRRVAKLGSGTPPA